MAKKRASGIEPPKKQSRRLGYVDGKMQIIEAPIYDGVLDEVTVTPNTQAIYNMMENPFGGTASTYEPSDLTTYLLNKAANPFTTAGFLARGQKVPDRVESKGNVFDMAADIVNPAAWVDYADKGFEDLKKGDLPGAGLNFLGATPALPATKSALFPKSLIKDSPYYTYYGTYPIAEDFVGMTRASKNLNDVGKMKAALEDLGTAYDDAATKMRRTGENADRFINSQKAAYRQANLLDDVYNVKAPEVAVEDVLAGPQNTTLKDISDEFVEAIKEAGVVKGLADKEDILRASNVGENMDILQSTWQKQLDKFNKAQDDLILKVYDETGQMSASPLPKEEGIRESLIAENPKINSSYSDLGEDMIKTQMIGDENNVLNEYIRQNPDDKVVRNFLKELENYRQITDKSYKFIVKNNLEELKATVRKDQVPESIKGRESYPDFKRKIEELDDSDFMRLLQIFTEESSGNPEYLALNSMDDLGRFGNEYNQFVNKVGQSKKGSLGSYELMMDPLSTQFIPQTLRRIQEVAKSNLIPEANYMENYLNYNVSPLIVNSESRVGDITTRLQDAAELPGSSLQTQRILNKSKQGGVYGDRLGSTSNPLTSRYDRKFEEELMARSPLKSEFVTDYSNNIGGIPIRRLSVLPETDNLVRSRADAYARLGEKNFKPLADKVYGTNYINNLSKETGIGKNQGLYKLLAEDVGRRYRYIDDTNFGLLKKALNESDDINRPLVWSYINNVEKGLDKAIPFYRNYSQPLVTPIRTYSNNRNK